ncbi:hypothetical protein HU200_027874 [Digitaria exilis]|uniref:F-box domain-containing protein n=1 Tax=Digitaria exilis TaxID=1010633 RepID=A0A835EVY4_9POAL|nr:hypothetical protein HU200_027874 [Digitaria exilis]
MAPPLPTELEEEILLRFPPHEPELLVRASLVCKRWRRLVSAPAFRRRLRDLHRAPPMLGFLCNIAEDPEGSVAAFVSTGTFRPPGAGLGHRLPIDARHGRVLLHYYCPESSVGVLVVWGPATGDELELPLPDMHQCAYSWTAAVLCASRAPCGHLDCHRGGPFLVVFVGSGARKAFICTYSSDAATWTNPIDTETELPLDFVNLMPSVLVGNTLYFAFPVRKTLLKYDLESQEMSLIGVPSAVYMYRPVVLDSGLALATVHESKLCIWRKAAGSEQDAGWTQSRAIELETLLPSDAFLTSRPDVVGFAAGLDVIFLRARLMLFTIDLKTCEVKKVCEGRNIYSAIPYVSFHTPGTVLLELQFYNIQYEQ